MVETTSATFETNHKNPDNGPPNNNPDEMDLIIEGKEEIEEGEYDEEYDEQYD